MQSNSDKNAKAAFNTITTKLINEDTKLTKDENKGRNGTQRTAGKRETRIAEAKERSRNSAFTAVPETNVDKEVYISNQVEASTLLPPQVKNNSMNDFIINSYQKRKKELGL